MEFSVERVVWRAPIRGAAAAGFDDSRPPEAYVNSRGGSRIEFQRGGDYLLGKNKKLEVLDDYIIYIAKRK